MTTKKKQIQWFTLHFVHAAAYADICTTERAHRYGKG